MSAVGTFDLITILTVMTCAFSYVNARYLKIPISIGVMVIGLVFSLLVVLLDRLGVPLVTHLEKTVGRVNFSDLLLYGMLGFLLFAGALQLDLSDFLREKWQIGVFSVGTTALSVLLIGGGVFGLSKFLDLKLDFLECLIFGAIISPTDPIATLAILQQVGAPKPLRVDITGESLFNDAVGVVIFLTLIRLYQGTHIEFGQVAGLFAVQAGGGIAVGLLLGLVGRYLIRSVEGIQVQLMITLALAAAGYCLADHVPISGPLVVIVSGLVIGSLVLPRLPAANRVQIGVFWRLVDEMLNALLFALVGLEVVVFEQVAVTGPLAYAVAGLAAIPLALAARYVSLSIPFYALKAKFDFAPHTLKIMTWGGLRGALCIALALAIPAHTPAQNEFRRLAVMMTYMVAIFSILVQGLTIKGVVRRALRGATADEG